MKLANLQFALNKNKINLVCIGVVFELFISLCKSYFYI